MLSFFSCYVHQSMGGLDSHLHVVSAGNLQDLHRPLKSKEESKPTRRESTGKSKDLLKDYSSKASCQDLSDLSKVRCYLDRLLSRLLPKPWLLVNGKLSRLLSRLLSKSWVLVNGKLSRLVRLVQGKVLLVQVEATVQVMSACQWQVVKLLVNGKLSKSGLLLVSGKSSKGTTRGRVGADSGGNPVLLGRSNKISEAQIID